MKVLLLSPSYAPRTGGLETYAACLCTELARTNNQVVVLTNRDDASQSPIEHQNGLTIRRADGLLGDHGLANYVPWERAYFGLLNDLASVANEHFDVIHCHTQVALLLAHLSGLHETAPIVASFHETNPLRDALGEQRTRFILRNCLADLYAVGSEAFAHQAQTLGIIPERIRIVTMGIAQRSHIERYEARERLSTLFDVPTDGCLISLIGRFTPRKEHHRLITAYKEMQLATTSRLLLVGSDNSTDPAYIRSLRDLVRSAGANIHLLENIIDSDRDTVVDASDIGVQPSSMEGLGLAAVEFMIAGAPVLVSDIPGLREVVGPYTECLLDTSHPTTFANRLDKLVGDPKNRSSLGERLQAYAQRELSIARAASQTIAVYREAVGTWSPPQLRGMGT